MSKFRTGKTKEELDSMSDEQYFIEVLKGLPHDERANKWWRGVGKKSVKQPNPKLLRQIYDKCKRG